MSVNKQILFGYVGKDPEIIDVNGSKVAKFSIATDESYKNKAGEKVEQTEWHNIVGWNHLAELAEKYITKGMKLYVEGKTTHREYEVDGVKRYATEVKAFVIELPGRNVDNIAKAPPLDTPQVEEGSDLPF